MKKVVLWSEQNVVEFHHICPKYTYLELKAALHQEFNRLDILLNKNMVFQQKAIKPTVLRLL